MAGNAGQPEETGFYSKTYAELRGVFIEGQERLIFSVNSHLPQNMKIDEKKSGWMQVHGKSMNRVKNGAPIEDGDYILVSRQESASDKDIVVAQYQDKQSGEYFILIKRYDKKSGTLKSETAETGAGYADIDIQKKGIQIKGVVRAVAKLF